MTGNRMFKVLSGLFLAIVLAACAPVQPNIDIQSTAVAIVETGIALTQTAAPPTFSPTATIVYPTPSPIPTLPPPPILMPDAIQVERWQEYQVELAKVILSGYSPALGYDPDLYKYALCEWDILGRSGQKVYVWAVCGIRGGVGAESPVVIYLEADGSIRKVRFGGYTGTSYNLELFPTEVQEKIHLHYSPPYPYEGRPEVLRIHLLQRQTHSDMLPLVVLSAMPTATPAP